MLQTRLLILRWLVVASLAYCSFPVLTAEKFVPPLCKIFPTLILIGFVLIFTQTATGLCRYGAIQTMSHIVDFCPLTKLYGGLPQLYSADNEAVAWLTSLLIRKK